MAKEVRKAVDASTGEAFTVKEVAFDDKVNQPGKDGKRRTPPGYRVISPYGKAQYDVGSMEAVDGGRKGVASTGGAATGDDGNTGSTGARTGAGRTA